MRNIFLIFSIFILFLPGIAFTQSISMPARTSYPCGTMSFPITASGFSSNVGAVTLYVETDPDVLVYTGNTPGTLTGYFLFYNSTTGLVTVSKTSVTPMSLNGTMLTLNFNYIGGSCGVDFGPACEFATVGPPSLNISFSSTNGSAGPMPRTNYYVDAARPPGGDGLTWATAFNTITAATNATLTRGAHVTIKPGTYNEAVVIKSNGLELVPLKTGVSVTDSNTVFFPSGTNLDCIDPGSYPDEVFLYLYRSLRGNNGVYEVESINTTTRMVKVRRADFKAEAGALGDTTKLQASIAHAIVYRKDTTNANPVIVTTTGISTARAVCYIGNPSNASGSTVSASTKYNIIDGLNLTGMASPAYRYGLRIQGGSYNVFMRGSIYSCDSVGVLVHGTTTYPAKRNIICDNTIYNIKQKGIKLGIEGQTASNNRVHQNLVLRNEVYSTGAGPTPGFYTMAETHVYTSHNIIEKNTFRNFSFIVANKGAIYIGSNSPSNLIIGNFLRDITDILAGTNAFIYINNDAPRTQVFNNVLLMSSATDDNIYAFRFNSQGHTLTKVVYNTVYNIDRGVLFEDPGIPIPDFSFRNNIMHNINDLYFVHSGNGGRFTVSNNCYGVTPTQSGGTYYLPGSTSSVVGNPLFLAPSFTGSPYGLSVKSGSICLGAAAPLTDIVVDLHIDSRSTTTPTIGAFENIITGVSWMGSVSNDWHDFRNWTPEIVPTQELDVIIPSRNLDPFLINSSGSCKSIEIQQGAEVIVNSPYTLNILN